MQEMDSIVEEPIKSEQGSVELTDLNSNDNRFKTITKQQLDNVTSTPTSRQSVTSRNRTTRLTAHTSYRTRRIMEAYQ